MVTGCMKTCPFTIHLDHSEGRGKEVLEEASKAAVTCFPFLALVGETQESFCEQKYLLNIPLAEDDEVIIAPP